VTQENGYLINGLKSPATFFFDSRLKKNGADEKPEYQPQEYSNKKAYHGS